MTPIDRMAAFLMTLHPAWRERKWEDTDEGTRELFREDARNALRAWRGE